jgi:hypothetical protein
MFERGFREMEGAILADGGKLEELPAADLEHAWRAAKRRLAGDD